VGTTVLAEKICGAAAERGYDLARTEALCRRVNANGRSMGMALTSCTVPAAGKPTFELGEDEMELGIGIHGEPGRQRLALQPAREVAERMTEAVVADLPFRGGDAVIAMVNGLGGTPLMELYLVYREVARILEGKGIRIARPLVGNYITSLEMAGCSITLLRADEEMLARWDDPVLTPGLRWGL
jgi:dihydroxyacetone kinase-like protein